MRFKIKHEEKTIQIVTLVSFLLIFVVMWIPSYLIGTAAICSVIFT